MSETSEPGVSPNTKRCPDQERIVADFVRAALHGDLLQFAQNFPALDWPGAWREAFARLVAAGTVHPSIPAAFVDAWRRVKAATRERTLRGPQIRHLVSATAHDWHLERDLDGHLDLLVAGLKLLLPPFPDHVQPFALYRGQRLEDHHAGLYGVWWCACPIFAERFATMPSRVRGGTGAVVVTFVPEGAIIGVLDGECLMDPRALDSVQLVAALPPKQMSDLQDPERAFRLAGIPDGMDGNALLDWLDQGRPTDGLPGLRTKRTTMLRSITGTYCT